MKKKGVYYTKRGSQRARQALAGSATPQKPGYQLEIQPSPAKIMPAKEKQDFSLSTQEKEDLKALKKREEPQDILDRLNAEVRTFKPVEIKAATKSPARENGRSPSKTRKLLADAMANSTPPKKSTTYKLHQTPITSFTTVRDPYWRTSWYSPYRSIFSKPSGKQEGYCF